MGGGEFYTNPPGYFLLLFVVIWLLFCVCVGGGFGVVVFLGVFCVFFCFWGGGGLLVF